MKERFYGNWSDLDDVIAEFEDIKYDEFRVQKIRKLKNTSWKGIQIIFAAYTYEDYSGTAFVIFKCNGKLYEVNGSHCSCYGLEGQWDPEETTKYALKHTVEHHEYGVKSAFKKEILDCLKHVRECETV